MKKKILLQIFLFTIIIIISWAFYKKYFFIDNSISQVKEKNVEKNTNLGNIIKNIEYLSSDIKGRKYIISAKTGTIDKTNSEIIYMNNVDAKIIFLDGSVALISSDKALYNNLNYSTKFKENVYIKYLENEVFANNLNLHYEKNILEAYNNLIYKNENSKLLADKVVVDLITKNIKVFNFDEKKVIINHQND